MSALPAAPFLDTGLVPLEHRLLRETILPRLQPKHETVDYPDRLAPFIAEVLGADLWDKQGDIADAVDDHPRVAVASCHGAGKSMCSARIALAFLHTRPHSIVLTTAPTGRQVEHILWRELRVAVGRSRRTLLGRALQTRYEIGPDWYALGLKPADNDPDRAQGFHCLDEEHTILTRRGWLGVDEIAETDFVLSVPNDGDVAEWMPITAKHCYDFDGELNVHEGRFVDFAVTDDHRFPSKYAKTDRHWTMRRMRDVAGQFTVRRVSGWNGAAFDVPKPFVDRGLTPERVAELIGFWTGDGGTRAASRSGGTREVLFYQVKDDGGYLQHLLRGLPTYKGRDYYGLSDRAMAEWLCEVVGRYQHERRIPREILDSTPEILDAWLEGFWRAEGTYVSGDRRTVYNTSKRLMDDVQEVLIKLGRPATLGINTAKGTLKHSPVGTFVARHDCWCLSWAMRPADATIKRREIHRRRYTGRVWCISTPYQTFYTRRNGRVVLSGNSEHILVIIDEAAGVDDRIIEVLEGALTSANSRFLMIGNPTSSSGAFHRAFHKERGSWHTIRIRAEDTPNFGPDGVIRPYLVTPEWVEDKITRFGADSTYVKSRVDAEFPEGGSGALIPLSWIEAADARRGDEVDDGAVEAGLDVARYGDDENVLTVRAGGQVLAQVVWSGVDTMETVGRAAHEIAPWRDELSAWKVDVIGIGSGVADRLRELGYPIIDVNVASASSDSEAWPILRHELWWQLRERFREGRIGGPLDDETMAQCSDVRYKYGSTYTHPIIESKDEAKKRGIGSPDRAESLMLAFGRIPVPDGVAGAFVVGRTKGWVR